MTPPEASVAGKNAGAATMSPAVSICLGGLTKRADFLRTARGKRQATPGFALQARKRGSDEAAPALIRVGFTCTKKVGNAVARNRAKRRLRALARAILPESGRPGWDYVLIGRAKTTASRDFAQMKVDLTRALDQIHGELA